MHAESLDNECFLICAVYLVFKQRKVRSYLAAGGGI